MFTGSINICSVGSTWHTASVSQHLALRYLFFIKPVSFTSIPVIRLRHRRGFLHTFFFPALVWKLLLNWKQPGVSSTCVFRPPGGRLIYSVCFFRRWLRGEHASQINTSAAGRNVVSVRGLWGNDETVWKDTVNACNCTNTVQCWEDYRWKSHGNIIAVLNVRIFFVSLHDFYGTFVAA